MIIEYTCSSVGEIIVAKLIRGVMLRSYIGSLRDIFYGQQDENWTTWRLFQNAAVDHQSFFANNRKLRI